MLGAGWLAFLVVASFTAPLWRPYEVDEQDLANRLERCHRPRTGWAPTRNGPRPAQPDLHRRRRAAARLDAHRASVAFGIGIPLALLAAERGRRTEQVTSRLTEVVHGAALDRSCCWP